MKWINGYTEEEKIRQKGNWNIWFAWFPVIIGYTSEHRTIKVWLQNVERKGTYHDGYCEPDYVIYEYRELTKKEN